jgi:hypothetical protein
MEANEAVLTSFSYKENKQDFHNNINKH